jgi:hypothetical protein
MYDFPYRLDPVCSLHILEGAGMDVIGEAPEGVRLHAFLKGGRVDGERLHGTIRPVGGGWSVFRRDDVCDIDIRMCLEMHDGPLIYLRYGGILDLGPDGVRKLLAGELHGKLRMHTAPRMSAGHPDYAWVNKRQFVGIGELDLDHGLARYDIYALA